MEGHNVASEVRRFISNIEAMNPEIVAGVRIRQAWEACVDASILSHTDAVYVVPDSNASDVIVYVDSNIWTTDLSLQSELLRLKMNLFLRDQDEASPRTEEGRMFAVDDPEKIKRLRFITSKEKYRGKQPHHISTADQLLQEDRFGSVEPIPLTPEEESDLRQQVAGIENEQLRQAAYEAAKADLELKKGIKNAETAQN